MYGHNPKSWAFSVLRPRLGISAAKVLSVDTDYIEHKNRVFSMNFEIQASGLESMPHRNSYQIESMGVGDCIFTNDYRTAQSARVAAFQFVKRRELSWKFSIRKMRDGWRIFRVS